MRDLFFDLLKQPSTEAFLELRQQVASSPNYSPYDSVLSDAMRMISEEDFEGAIEHLGKHMAGNLLLSPGAHFVLGHCAEKSGDAGRAGFERAIGELLLAMIASTGDGTQARPYLVMRTSDEYDLLGAMGKTLAQQALIHEDDRSLDRIETEDGETLWFDVSMALARLNQSMSGG